MKSAPTLLPAFEPSEKRRTSVPEEPEELGGGRGKTWFGLNCSLVGSDGRLSGRGRPMWSRTGNVCSDHGTRSEARASMCRGGCPQERVGLVFHSLVIGYGTEWRPVVGSRHVMVEGKQGGRAAVAGFVTGDPQAMRRV